MRLPVLYAHAPIGSQLMVSLIEKLSSVVVSVLRALLNPAQFNSCRFPFLIRSVFHSIVVGEVPTISIGVCVFLCL